MLPAQSFETRLPLRVGVRTLLSFRRELVRVPLRLEEALEARAPVLPPLNDEADGYLISALPEAQLGEMLRRRPELKPFVRQRYRRSYVRLDQSFDDYIAGFPAKRRSTLTRKARKLAKASGGTLDVRSFHAEEQVPAFYEQARRVSEKTYQERLLDAGLPAGPEALAEMRELARAGQLRAWLLYLNGQPISYLYAPAQGNTLIYAHLGYDPDFAEHSPGSVLQLQALQELMEEGRFRLFDFTEGEGQHKRQFASGEVECLDLLLVKPTIRNLSAGYTLSAFDGGVAIAKRTLTKLAGPDIVRRFRR
jgi:CelD/BcsL family acetyltransferase involved in cellulose biosynthesis